MKVTRWRPGLAQGPIRIIFAYLVDVNRSIRITQQRELYGFFQRDRHGDGEPRNVCVDEKLCLLGPLRRQLSQLERNDPVQKSGRPSHVTASLEVAPQPDL